MKVILLCLLAATITLASACDGGWNAGTCSTTCGEGVSLDTFHGTGTDCEAQEGDTKTSVCNLGACGGCGWEAGECSATCGDGVSLDTFHGSGEGCEAQDGATKTSVCNRGPCGCGWEAGECSATCGDGVSLDTFHGSGEGCEAQDGATKTSVCNRGSCGECGWEAGECSATCGDGVSLDTFHGMGPGCEAQDGATKTSVCHQSDCPTCENDGWRDGGCSVTCTTGVRVYTYVGTGPGCPNQYGDTRTEECDMGPCDHDCEGHWEEGTQCSARCGGGVTTDTFIVTYPKRGTGSDCEFEANATKTSPCNTPECGVCGNGIREFGEQCDPPAACCTSDCLFKPRGVFCRKARTQCWADQYCTGKHGACPRLRPKKDWTPCDDGISYTHEDSCHNGRCYGIGKHFPVPDHVRIRFREVDTTSSTSLYRRTRNRRG